MFNRRCIFKWWISSGVVSRGVVFQTPDQGVPLPCRPLETYSFVSGVSGVALGHTLQSIEIAIYIYIYIWSYIYIQPMDGECVKSIFNINHMAKVWLPEVLDVTITFTQAKGPRRSSSTSCGCSENPAKKAAGGFDSLMWSPRASGI